MTEKECFFSKKKFHFIRNFYKTVEVENMAILLFPKVIIPLQKKLSKF